MRIRFALLSTAASLVIASGARAQSVNYGQLEQFFGEPVTTSAIGSPQKAADVPANMQIISSDEIRRSGAVNIPDILRFYAGIDVRQSGAGDATVSIRGYGQSFNPRLLVLVNGRQVYIDDYGYVAWQTLPVQLDEIRQIEVVKGPASALFGFNAVSGVINIVTVDPLSDSTNVATARGGSDAFIGGDGVATFHAGDTFGLRLSVGGYRDQEYSSARVPAVELPVENRPFQRSFSADARYKPTGNSEVTAEATVSNSDNAALGGPGGALNRFIDRTDSVKLGYAVDTDWGLMNLDAYRNEARVDAGPGVANLTPVTDLLYVVQANDVFKIGTDNTIRVGLDYRNGYGVAPLLLSSSVGYADYAASAMWNWQIDPQWALTNALRVDRLELSRSNPVSPLSGFSQSEYNNTSVTAPSFNSGLVYKPSGADTVRVLVARGVQAPSLIDSGLQILIPTSPATKLVLSGNPDLNPSTETNYEIDYDRALPALSATLRTAFYYQKNEQILSSGITQPLAVLPGFNLLKKAANIGNSAAFGGEIGIQGENLSGLRWNLAYSLVRITDDLTVGTTGNPSPTPWGFNHSTPTSAVDFGLGYSWSKFEADLRGKWQSSFSDYLTSASNLAGGYTPVVVKDYLTLNARLGYNVTGKITVAVTGQQLNQQTVYQTTGLPVERRGIFSVTFHY